MNRLFSILSLSFLMFALSLNACFSKDIKFAQVTDLYFRGNSTVMDSLVQDINKDSEIDFVVFTGNNIGKPTVDVLKKFLKSARKLNKPYYMVLGNKDVSKSHNMEKSTYLKTVKKYNIMHPTTPNYTFKKGNVVFIVVDGSKELIPSPNGFYSKDTIKWVDKQIKKAKNSKVVILQHFPLMNKPGNEYYTTYNILEYMQMLSKHTNVLAVVSGHYDKNDEIIYNGVDHITTPRSAGGCYKIIDIVPENGYSVYTFLKEVKNDD